MTELIHEIDEKLEKISERYKQLLEMEAKIQLAYRDLDFRRDYLQDERARLASKRRIA